MVASWLGIWLLMVTKSKTQDLILIFFQVYFLITQTTFNSS